MSKPLFRDESHSEERAFYGFRGVTLVNCRFEGAEDGESALKECADITAEDCIFSLRYPLWHCKGSLLYRCQMNDTCRAPLWYSEHTDIRACRISGVKALRECIASNITDSRVISNEFGWKCKGFTASDTYFEGEYLFLNSTDISLEKIELKGKYSFQYIENATVKDSVLDTKDAFWHAKNVTVSNCRLKGEYLGWYSENLRLVNCEIIGTQPLCYARGLILENCVMINTDLAFEKSEVTADIAGEVESVKNPKSGIITADSFGEIILDLPSSAIIRKRTECNNK